MVPRFIVGLREGWGRKQERGNSQERYLLHDHSFNRSRPRWLLEGQLNDS
jgi:hypothetical protein